METIPTAEEVYLKFTKCVMNHRDIKTAMIEFAKLHVTEALKVAWQNASAINKPKFEGDCNPVVDDESILNAYSLDNIK